MYNQEQGVVSEFYKNNFADERKGIFRYLFIAHGGGWCYPQDYHHYYDCMCVPSKQVFYKNNLDLAISPRAKRIGRAVQVMHELGHSCGFNKVQHTPGVDNRTTDWLDYQSVMNYWYFIMIFSIISLFFIDLPLRFAIRVKCKAFMAFSCTFR